MDVLVAHGSKRGGTAEIAERIAETLRTRGFDVDVLPAHDVRDVRKYGAVILGGALYAGHWFHEARRLAMRHCPELRQRHVWFFSSGPLNDAALAEELGPIPQVAALLGYVGGNGHATFGGRLAKDAHGFIASAMAQRFAGDWRDAEQIEAWALEIAERLTAEPTRAPRPSSAFAPLPSRSAIIALCVGAGLFSLLMGVSLVVRPDGALLRLPQSALTHSPFHDYLIAGLALLVIGAGNALSAVLHLRRNFGAPSVSLLSGLVLIVWMALHWRFHPIQAASLALGAAIVAISARLIRDQAPDEPSCRETEDGGSPGAVP